MNSNKRTTNKKQKILEKSIKLFATNDIKKVTMDDLADYANVSKMTIYKYFGDRELLYKHVGKEVLARYSDNLYAIQRSEENLVQKMIQVTSILSEFIIKNHLSLCLKLSMLSDEVENAYRLFDDRAKEVIIQLIKEGKKAMLIRDDISDDSVYHYINMGLNYFQHNMEYRQKIMNSDSFKKEFMTFIWRNIFIDCSQFTI